MKYCLKKLQYGKVLVSNTFFLKKQAIHIRNRGLTYVKFSYAD